jgi:alpha-galactosidase
MTPTAKATHGYGVKTGAGAFCFWQVDPSGVSLWLDVSNGSIGVMLGERELRAATVVSRRGRDKRRVSERRGCGSLQDDVPESLGCLKQPVYGTNDWYYAYGKNSEASILRDTDLVVSLAPADWRAAILR